MGCKVTQLPALLDKQASYRKVGVLVDHKLVKVFSSLKWNFFESVDDLNLPAPTAFVLFVTVKCIHALLYMGLAFL
jgi:hypothetical protein